MHIYIYTQRESEREMERDRQTVPRLQHPPTRAPTLPESDTRRRFPNGWKQLHAKLRLTLELSEAPGLLSLSKQ